MTDKNLDTNVNANGAVTDPNFWNSQWSELLTRSFSNRLIHSRDFGQKGMFMRVWNRHAADIKLKDAKLIEIGGAASMYLVDFAGRGAIVTALDYSEVGIARTNALFRASNIEGRVLKADMYDWHDEDNSFDLVTHWGLLEHFEDVSPVLEVCQRLLKPGGHIVFSMPNLLARGAGLWKYFAPENYSFHVKHSDESIEAAAKKLGLHFEKKFHFGIPLVRMAPPEKSNLAAYAVNAVHVAFCAVATVFPSLFVTGLPRVSMNRGFIIRKPL
jgi:2-polyprenyl-3-methyl-5-hydroxy-6-metoxy-1,4-benzoquinol methylase